MKASLHPRLVNGPTGDPALYVERLHDRSALLFDLGDLGPLSARDLLRVTHAFVSHAHVDHFIGFDALLRVHVGRDKRIELFGPEGMIDRVAHKLGAYQWDIAHRYATELTFAVTEIRPEGSHPRAQLRLSRGFAAEPLPELNAGDQSIAEVDGITVSAAVLEHHGPCIGYAFEEPRRANVWSNKVAERGLPVGPWLKSLKRAVLEGRTDDWPILLPDGSEVPLGTIRDLVSVGRGQKIGYVTDIRDTPGNRTRVAQLCSGADTLFIEAVFLDRDSEVACDRAHLTARAAGEIARAAGARRVEPFHFSPRYEDGSSQLTAELRAAFSS